MKFESDINSCGEFYSEGTYTENGETFSQTVRITNATTTQFSGTYSIAGASGEEVTICDAILPITILSFTSEKSVNGNILSWATSEEINSDHFDVERSSNNISFNLLTKVNAAGNSAYVQHYGFTDAKPFEGTNYYRLKMVD